MSINLIQNPSFESGVLDPPWQTAGSGAPVFDGTFYAAMALFLEVKGYRHPMPF
ncbi:hypothetical protein [Paenibacillus humicola]|uniref:hypothetical protein n=1 Tax=Paenibacillus humicola TaxID=3110540 RepID=UPI00237C2B49|nr:hypothetical protein [Paenibacillus humicola]